MRFRRTTEQEPRLGIAPLIDIVFLLLIFFMVTSHFDVASGVRIRLPRMSQHIYGSEEFKMRVLLDRKGQIYLEGDRLDSKTLSQRLKDAVAENGVVHLVLEADEDVRHGLVVQVMELAKRAGVHSVVIAARWDAENVF
jgi:biopolymer transport protein ExbD